MRVKITKYIIVCFSLFLIIGCKESYRYPCQDPEKEKDPQCTPHMCEVTRLCPKRN